VAAAEHQLLTRRAAQVLFTAQLSSRMQAVRHCLCHRKRIDDCSGEQHGSQCGRMHTHLCTKHSSPALTLSSFSGMMRRMWTNGGNQCGQRFSTHLQHTAGGQV
jgi:hypothetical protein